MPPVHRRGEAGARGQQNPDNREIIRELRASADRIFDVLSGLEVASDLATEPVSGRLTAGLRPSTVTTACYGPWQEP